MERLLLHPSWQPQFTLFPQKTPIDFEVHQIYDNVRDQKKTLSYKPKCEHGLYVRSPSPRMNGIINRI